MKWWTSILVTVFLLTVFWLSESDSAEKLNKTRMDFCQSLNERTVAMVTLDGQFACVPTLTRIP